MGVRDGESEVLSVEKKEEVAFGMIAWLFVGKLVKREATRFFLQASAKALCRVVV